MRKAQALFLPPAPHTGAFFDAVRASLTGIETVAATYPGYGDIRRSVVSIPAYGAALLKEGVPPVLIGFHTGCLVALEMAAQSREDLRLILIDIPYFDADTKTRYAAKLDPNDPKMDAFRAAFAYDADSAFVANTSKVTVIATQSSLFEPTVKAASLTPNCHLIERRDIEKPAMDNPAMSALLNGLIPT